MPIHRNAASQDAAVAIVGCFAGDGQSIQHVGLRFRSSTYSWDSRTTMPIADMDMRGPRESSMPVDLQGWLDGTDDTVFVQMEQWVQERIRSGATVSWNAVPAWKPVDLDPVTHAELPYTHFSCAGFVARCFWDYPRIQLVADEASLPKVELRTLKGVWANIQRLLDNEKLRSRYGLEGKGPWPILMPAYLFHAIRAHDTSGHGALPYTPQEGDWQFLI